MWKRVALASVALLGIAGALVLALFGVPGFAIVPTGAMANTILPGDHILTSSRIGTIKRGDIILFRYPKNPKERYVKRVVALPGESIQLVGTDVIVDGKPLPERIVLATTDVNSLPGKEMSSSGAGPYSVYYDLAAASGEPTQFGGSYGVSQPYTVPSGTVFVLGDNRDNSEDSRYWGPVPLENIVARPVLVYYSETGDSKHLFKTLR